MQSGNSKQMHKHNLAAIMRMVYDTSGISRKDIAARTGLTPATVTNIVAEVIREGLLVEIGEGQSGSGRKPIFLAVNRDRYCVIGIELTADIIVCVIADFCGDIIARASAPNKCDNTPNQAMHIAWRLASGLLAGVSRPKETVLGLGLMVPGTCERESGVLIDPPNFTGDSWSRVALRDMFQLMTGVPVVMERDSVGCALAEAEHADGGAMFAVTVGTAHVGGGMLIGSEVFYGRGSAAADIGHITVLPDGPPCACGSRGCLQMLSSGEALAKAVGEALGSPVAVADVIAAYRSGNSAAVAAVRRGAQHLGTAIGNIIRVVSPHCIAVGGRFVAMFPEYYDIIREYALAHHGAQEEEGARIIPFSHGEVQSVVGAVRLVINGFYNNIVL